MRCQKYNDSSIFSLPLIKLKCYHGQIVEIAIRRLGSFILVKSDLVTFDFLMSIMGLHGFSPAPWIAEINAFNEALINGKVGLCRSVKISFNSLGTFTMEFAKYCRH